jgi:hypothetical protein
MFQKAIENLRNLKKAALNKDTLVTELRSYSENIVKVTAAEREKILDRIVTQLLKGEELGDNAEAIRTKVRARLFAKSEGDALFVNNLKYVNEVLTGSLPASISELTGFRKTLAHKLVEDARGGTIPQRPLHRRDGAGSKSAESTSSDGERGGRRGDHRRGRNDRPSQQNRSEFQAGSEQTPRPRNQPQGQPRSNEGDAPRRNAAQPPAHQNQNQNQNQPQAQQNESGHGRQTREEHAPSANTSPSQNTTHTQPENNAQE